MESCPYQFECITSDEDVEPDNTSGTTKNQIFVLQAPTENGTSTDMMIVGKATLGKPNEVFTAVRFFDYKAYAVTFLQTDPLYAISFEDDPEVPEVLGELEISGFSNYMHSIDEDDTLILTLGMETDENGTEIGLQISVFDTTNQTNPMLISRYVDELSSGSSAQWDYQAFRYLKLDDEQGRIIIPLTSGTYGADDYFNGFEVFELNPAGIFPYFKISHPDFEQNLFSEGQLVANYTEPECFCAYLTDRSFVVDGNVITINGQSARSHDLTSGDFQWGLDFNGTDFCC
jgi:hypothetical protein